MSGVKLCYSSNSALGSSSDGNIGEESPNTPKSMIWRKVAGNPCRVLLAGTRGANRDESQLLQVEGETAKSLSECKAVLREQLCRVPLELHGDVGPR